MLSSALTRWLKQGLSRGMCPLCRVAHKLDREYIWYFFDEYSTQDAALDELRRAGGFCAEHAEQLRRVEVDGLKSTLGISTTYADTIEGVGADLDGLGKDDEFACEPCPACANRDEGVAKNAGYLLAELDESDRSRELFQSSPGLCLPHFELVWRTADQAQRELVLDVERTAFRNLAEDLREHVRKQGAEFKDEPPGREADAWRRALYLTGGWPAPEESAVVPEHGPDD